MGSQPRLPWGSRTGVGIKHREFETREENPFLQHNIICLMNFKCALIHAKPWCANVWLSLFEPLLYSSCTEQSKHVALIAFKCHVYFCLSVLVVINNFINKLIVKWTINNNNNTYNKVRQPRQTKNYIYQCKASVVI